MDNEDHLSEGESILAGLINGLRQGGENDDFSFTQIARISELQRPGPEKSALLECARIVMAVRQQLDLQQKRETGLMAVIESAQDLSRQLDLMSLLRAIVARARALLGAHVAWISVFNPDLQRMQVQVADGAISRETERMTTGRQFGLGSVVFATKRAFTTPDYLSDDRFLHDPALDAIFRDEGVAAMIGVPLLLDNEVIGLLFVADRYKRVHNAFEVSILSTLATHAAVALHNARTFDLTHRALERGDLARAALELHARTVQSAAEAHEQLTAMLARGASLAALCNHLARMLEARILVLDEALHVVCLGQDERFGDVSQGPLDHPDVPRLALEAARQQSRDSGRSVIVHAGAETLCRAVAIDGGTEVSGTMLVYTRAGDDEAGVGIIERSASFIGIAMLSQERLALHRHRDTAALLRGLLLPLHAEWSTTQERAEQFGLDPRKPLSLLLIESEALSASYLARRLRALPSLAGIALDEIDDVVTLVFPTPNDPDVVETCRRMLSRELGVEFRGIVSHPVPAEGLCDLYASLRRALLIVRRLGVNTILDQHELTLYSVLFETQDEGAINAFLTARLGPLFERDRKKKTDLAQTLLCYFDANRNARTVAKRLGIHVNTVHQRLASIEGLLGHLGNPVRALELHMALRLWALGKRTG